MDLKSRQEKGFHSVLCQWAGSVDGWGWEMVASGTDRFVGLVTAIGVSLYAEMQLAIWMIYLTTDGGESPSVVLDILPNNEYQSSLRGVEDHGRTAI